MTETTLALAPASESSALERRYSRALLKLNAGFGEKTQLIAEQFAEAGLPPMIANSVLQAIYAPSDLEGRGQGARAKWWVQAVRQHYGDRLEKARNNLPMLRTILGEFEEIVDMRDRLNETDSGVSFHGTFLLYAMGYTTEAIGDMIDSMDCLRGTAISRIQRAAMLVENGKASTIEGALEFLGFL